MKVRRTEIPCEQEGQEPVNFAVTMFPLLYLTEPERPGRVQILSAMAPIVTFINIMFGETFNGFPSYG